MSIEFKLLKDQQLTIELNRSIEDMMYEDVQITFYDSGYFILTKDCFIFLIQQLKELLLLGLNNELTLDPTIGSIGYSWNKLLHKIDNNQFEWTWQHYLLWETPGNIYPNLATWLYNDSEKNIILEITPVYPWHFTDSEADQDYISFFMSLCFC